MTTVDPPYGLLTLPTPSQIWSAVNMDRAVAITALVCGTVAFGMLVWGLTHTSDATAIAVALSLVVSTAIGAWLKGRGRSTGGPS